MDQSNPIDQQTHPLYSTDREILDGLLGKEKPESSDLAALARLFIRYESFLGALDIQSDLIKILNAWNLSREELNSKTQKIWADGYRPGLESDESVGSSFDTSNNNDI